MSRGQPIGRPPNPQIFTEPPGSWIEESGVVAGLVAGHP